MSGEASLQTAIPAPHSSREPGWQIAFVFILLLIGLHLIAGPVVRLSKWHVDYPVNPAFQEALAWRNGHLDLPHRERDTALFKDKIYSVHPPLFVLISVLATSIGTLQGVPSDQFYPLWYVLSVVLPLPIIGFWAFRELLGSSAWSAVMTGYWLLGTPMLPTLVDCQSAAINPLNHVLANAGLMLLGGDLLGRRRMWPAALGIVVMAWSRPHLLLFGIAAVVISWVYCSGARRKALIIAAVGFSSLTLAALNFIKFESPFETGYRYIYDYRPNSFLGSRFYAHGIFSPHFIPENAWTMNCEPPRFRLTSEFLTPESTEWGASIWMTCPLLLVIFPSITEWWRDRAARWLILASLLVIGFFLMYHSRGASTRGFHAYSLDYLAIWLLVICGWVCQGRRQWILLACFAWSAFYFNLISW